MNANKLGSEPAFCYATRTRKDYQAMVGYPNGTYDNDQIPNITETSGGMTKRELGAFMAMQGMWSDARTTDALAGGVTKPELLAKVASLAVDQADALLAELAK